MESVDMSAQSVSEDVLFQLFVAYIFIRNGGSRRIKGLKTDPLNILCVLCGNRINFFFIEV